MSGKNSDKNIFEEIHNLKNDAALLSGAVDAFNMRNEQSGEGVRKAFLTEYRAFVEKYENSSNLKVRAFVEYIKNIVRLHASEFVCFGIDAGENGELSVLKADGVIRASASPNDGQGSGVSTGENVFEIINKALLDAQIHMERFIPEKYLSYDKSSDYRILR